MFTTVIIPKLRLNKAIKLLNSGDYDSAYAIFEKFGDNEAITSSKYNRAAQYIDSGDYDSAYALFREVGDNEAIISSEYDRAIKCIDFFPTNKRKTVTDFEKILSVGVFASRHIHKENLLMKR